MPITTVYYFPTNAIGEEVGEPIPVTLKPDGSADLSKLPHEVSSSLEAFGMPDTFHRGFILPKDGERFLAALIREFNPYCRFRSKPTKATKR